MASTRRLTSLAAHGAAAVALVPAFIWLAPTTRWDNPVLLTALVVLAVIANLHDAPLPSGIVLDAGMALALIALWRFGPLAAYVVDLVPLVVGSLARREAVFRAGNLANVAAYGWKALAAAGILALGGHVTGADALPWLVLAGLAQYLTNWAVGPAIYGTLWLGHSRATMVRLLADTTPAAAIVLMLGAGTSVLMDSLGVLALAAFAVIAVLPQTALTYAARTRPVSLLDPLTATRRYAHALALHLGLSRADRRHLTRVAVLAHERRLDVGDPIAYACATLRDPSRASWEAGHVGEWWNGGGGPAGLRGPVTPLTSRIVAVADTWSQLTARGGPALSHAEALEELDLASGTRFDPRIVRAAHSVVAEERVSAHEPAPEPRLHQLRLPAPLRRVLATN